MSTLRNALCAACVALLPSMLAAQTQTRVMAHGGIMPFVSANAGGQVEITPRDGNTSYFAEYNRWAWGLVCVSLVGSDEGDERCAENGYTVHAGVTRHLRDAGSRWRPYVSGGAGVARVVGEDDRGHPLHASLAVEGGYDWGGARAFTLRLGARWQARPAVGTDYAGPVVGLRLRL
ncbi:MAG TPA: hypothetical protein VGX50_18315 [Longimicrobium sp.]|jgi:hypothetical protein|nr:hypothetical protein [Longimicrobium sp.]